jgi:hypothetical protein
MSDHDRPPRRELSFPLDVWLGNVLAHETPLAQPLRFGLLELMATITAAGALLALFRALGIVGAALAFFAALIFTNLAYPRLSPNSPARQAAMFDFVWGVVMPVVCLVYDPFVFKWGDTLTHEDFGRPGAELFRTATIHPWAWPIYVAIAWQITILGVWLVTGKLLPSLAAAWTGMLWAGFALASIVGVILILPATMAALIGIGFLGYTPLFTARAFYRRALVAGGIAMRGLPATESIPLAILGFVVAAAIPAILGVLAAWIWHRSFG